MKQLICQSFAAVSAQTMIAVSAESAYRKFCAQTFMKQSHCFLSLRTASFVKIIRWAMLLWSVASKSWSSSRIVIQAVAVRHDLFVYFCTRLSFSCHPPTIYWNSNPCWLCSDPKGFWLLIDNIKKLSVALMGLLARELYATVWSPEMMTRLFHIDEEMVLKYSAVCANEHDEDTEMFWPPI